MRACKGCRYFFTAGDQSSCRVVPPRVSVNFADEVSITSFPQPHPDAWCGLHKVAWGRLIRRLFSGNGT